MERRRLAANRFIQQSMTVLPRCRRAADAPSVTRYAKDSTKGSLKWLASHPFLFSGCLK
ncbi:hypothetical protein [Kingella oralis]|uniref:hypothetical protein n=1 Tax=Kingella oralis TaxID=505 RepID=UPI002D7FBF67|nr:hypothetical protein [Kingella oralis]